MAVVASGGETVVRYNRGLVAIYYILVIGSGFIAICCLLMSFAMASESGTWKGKLWSVVSWILGAVSFAMLAIQMYTMARAYGRTYVAVGPEGVRIHLPEADGDLLRIGKERRFQWNQIADITYEHDLRKRICRFTAGDLRYTLTQNNCPSPGKVAQLIADGKGVPLVGLGGPA